MSRRPTLLMAMAAVAALSTVAHAITATPAERDGPPTRLGVAINQDLAKRDQSGAARNRALALREQVARAAEERIKADLRARQQEAAAASASTGKASAESAQYDDLARIYQAMKPAKAALVFEQLDMDVQMKVAQRMRQRSTAMMLAAMSPAGAADLSMSLARRTPRHRTVERPAPQTGPAPASQKGPAAPAVQPASR